MLCCYVASFAEFIENRVLVYSRVLATWRQCGLMDVLMASPSHLWIIFDGVFQTEHLRRAASNELAAFLSFENRLMDPIRDI